VERGIITSGAEQTPKGKEKRLVRYTRRQVRTGTGLYQLPSKPQDSVVSCPRGAHHLEALVLADQQQKRILVDH
jgi:hypothetical protein